MLVLPIVFCNDVRAALVLLCLVKGTASSNIHCSAGWDISGRGGMLATATRFVEVRPTDETALVTVFRLLSKPEPTTTEKTT